MKWYCLKQIRALRPDFQIHNGGIMRLKMGTVLAAVLTVSACASPAPAPASVSSPIQTPTPTPEKFTATVTLEIIGPSYTYQKLYNVNTKTETGCQGAYAYDDLVYGGKASLLDLDDVPLSLAGEVVESAITATGCKLTYQFRRVVPGQKAYVLSLGHRKAVQHTEADLREGISLQIGG